MRTGTITWSAQTRIIHEVESDYIPRQRTLRDFYPDEALTTMQTAVLAATQSGTGWNLELPFITAKHRHLWINTMGSAEYENGKIVRLIGTIQDITERHFAAQRLRSSEAFLEHTGRIAGVGGWEIDLETHVAMWTAQTFRIYETDVIPPNYLTNLPNHPPAARALVLKAANAAIAHGEGWDLELPFITDAGADRWVRLVGTAEIRDGRPVRLIGTIQDITAQKTPKSIGSGLRRCCAPCSIW